MLFTVEVSVPKSTTSLDPVVQILPIALGIVTWVSVFFPPWCAKQLHVVILSHEHQIFPSTENMDLTGDAGAVEWVEYYECYQPPYELKIKAWNDDDVWTHAATVRVAVLPRKATAPASLADTLKSALGALLPKRIYTAGG